MRPTIIPFPPASNASDTRKKTGTKPAKIDRKFITVDTEQSQKKRLLCFVLTAILENLIVFFVNFLVFVIRGDHVLLDNRIGRIGTDKKQRGSGDD